MIEPKKAWSVFLKQAVKAIESGMRWSNDFGRTYFEITQTNPDYVIFKNTNDASFSKNSVKIVPEEVIEAAAKLAENRKTAVGKLFADERKEYLFVLLHPHVKTSKNAKYIKIVKRFRSFEPNDG